MSSYCPNCKKSVDAERYYPDEWAAAWDGPSEWRCPDCGGKVEVVHD